MFKIILKSADTELSRKTFKTPQEAVARWNSLRGESQYDGLPVQLMATWGNSVFLRHYFQAEPKQMEYIPADADVMPLFIAAAAGSGSGGAPRSEDRVDYSHVDWSKSDAQIGRELGVSRQTVRGYRLRNIKS